MSQVSLSQQLKEGNLFAEQCPSREVLKHVTSRWGVLILVALREGTHRFSDLRRKIGGVSEKMLAQSLRKRLVRTVLIFTESSDQLSRATDRVPGLPASPGYVQ